MGDERYDDDFAVAIGLGWRIAELNSRVDDLGVCSADTLLPVHSTLAPAEQLELQLRTAAGFAQRLGLECKPARLDELASLGHECVEDPGRQERYRAAVRGWHVDILKDLWARDEALGRAYELGNGLSDTYGRVSRAYREDERDPAQVWSEVFHRDRVERLKKLLDDLHCRLDPMAATVVREQLDKWRDKVDAGNVPDKTRFREPLRRQTVIWRQLVAGDKTPDAYLGDAERAKVLKTLRTLVWQRYSKFLPVLAAILMIAAVGLPPALAFYQDNIVPSGLTPLLVAGIGALGITRASIILTLRSRVHDWAELLWQRAMVTEVVQATNMVGAAFAKRSHTSRPRAIAGRVAGTLRSSVMPARPARQGEG
jgi:hypothetical protein